MVLTKSCVIFLGKTSAGFGGLGGLTAYSTRASQYRKQVSVSYAISNRSYNHRLMASIGTGELGNGWYLMAAASGRYSGSYACFVFIVINGIHNQGPYFKHQECLTKA